MSDSNPIPTIEQIQLAIKEELLNLWSDLSDAIGAAINGVWSMRCSNVEERIKALTPLVGPTPWDSVSISLLEFGVYQRIHEEMGIKVNPDMDRVAQVRASIEGRKAKMAQQAQQTRERTGA